MSPPRDVGFAPNTANAAVDIATDMRAGAAKGKGCHWDGLIFGAPCLCTIPPLHQHGYPTESDNPIHFPQSWTFFLTPKRKHVQSCTDLMFLLEQLL